MNRALPSDAVIEGEMFQAERNVIMSVGNASFSLIVVNFSFTAKFAILVYWLLLLNSLRCSKNFQLYSGRGWGDNRLADTSGKVT